MLRHVVALLIIVSVSHAKLNSAQPNRILKVPVLVPDYAGPEDGAAKKGVPVKGEVQAAVAKGHRSFGIGVVSALCVTCILISMLGSTNSFVVQKTWHMIDHVLQHFLGYAWFVVVIEGLSYLKVEGIQKIFVHGMVAVAFLLAVIFGSWAVHEDNETLSIFVGIFLIMVCWANMGFVSTVQQHGENATQVLFLSFVMVGFYAALSVALFPLVSTTCEKGWGDSSIDKVTGKALGAGLVLWIHMVISGSYQSIVGDHQDPPTMMHKIIFVSISCCFLVVAILVKPRVDEAHKRISATNYWNGRVLQVLSKFLNGLPHFAFAASFGHLILESDSFEPGTIDASLALGVSNTFIAVALVLIAARWPGQSTKMLPGVGAFIMAVAWAKLLDNSCNMMMQGDGYGHPFLIKITVTGLLSAFIVPTYWNVIKPLIMKAGG
jgi:hypothetical protein